MFGGASTLGEKGDAPEMKVQSLVQLSGVGVDLVVGTPATVVASGDFVGLDFDRLATNADMFRAYLQRLKSSGSGLVCYNERWQDDISCYTRRFFLLLPGDRSFLLRQLATGDHTVPMPQDCSTATQAIPAAIHAQAQDTLDALPSADSL